MSINKEEQSVELTYQGATFKSEYYNWVKANLNDPFGSTTPTAFVEIKNGGTVLTSSISPDPTFIPLLTPVTISVETIRSMQKNFTTQNSTISASIKITPVLVVIESGPNLNLYTNLFESFGKQTGANFTITIREVNNGIEGRPTTREEVFTEAMILSLKQTETEILILFDFIGIKGTSKSLGSADGQGTFAYEYDKRKGWEAPAAGG